MILQGQVAVAVLVLSALYALKIYRQFAKNLADAKASGITYIIVPFYLANRFFQVACIVILPILRSLPTAWTESWLDFTLEWGWIRRYEPFKSLGADTFLTVSLERNILNTAEASVIAQITNRRNDFPKALEVYESLKIYGKNVLVAEDQEWRHHRKIVSPPFTEKNNHLVWAETLRQSQGMVNSWFGQDQNRSKNIRTVLGDTRRLSLHIISKAGFGVSLSWPEGEDTKQLEKESSNSAHLSGGHKMTYTDALGSLLHNILWLLVLPQWLLKCLPFKGAAHANESYIEWGMYMREMLEKKKAEVHAGDEGDKADLMLAMLKGAGVSAQSSTEKEIGGSTQQLTDQEIIGNAFVFMIAGHETTANSINFTLTYLALNISSQRRLQKDLDEIFQGRPIREWDYDRHLPRLFGSMAEAVMNEQLRLLPPIVSIPKSTPKNSPQKLTVGGKVCIVPKNTYISLIGVAAHRNPNQWPTGPPADPENPAHPFSNVDNDLEEFKPERWLLDSDAKKAAGVRRETAEIDEASALGINTTPDVSPKLYRPEKGAYIPFSEGYRSCIGRRFAQVELLAVMAFIFTQYSVELAVEEWASDEQLENMDAIGKREVWEKAKVKVDTQMRDDIAPLITLQLLKGNIPLRLVKRGKEIFDYK